MQFFKRSFYLFIAFLITLTPCLAQDPPTKIPEGIFIDLEEVKGIGPFKKRKGFEQNHLTGTFQLAGKEYRVYILRQKKDKRKQRFLFEKANTELQFSEGNGLPVYYMYETVKFDSLEYDTYGYRSDTNQFILLKKEDVPYFKEGIAKGERAPDYLGEDLKGEQLRLSNYGNKYIMIDFWGTWCGPCLKETPYLKEAYSKFSDQIEFIGIAVDDDTLAVKKYIADNNIQWPQIHVANKYYGDPAPVVAKYNVRGYPAYFLVNPKGKIVIGPEQDNRLQGEKLYETLSRVLKRRE